MADYEVMLGRVWAFNYWWTHGKGGDQNIQIVMQLKVIGGIPLGGKDQ